MIRVGPMLAAEATQLSERLRRDGYTPQLEVVDGDHFVLLDEAAASHLQQLIDRVQDRQWQQGEPLPASAELPVVAGWRWRPRGPLTSAVITLTLLVYLLLTLIPAQTFDLLRFFTDGEEMAGWGQWRWITPVLLHFSPLHLLFNLLWWWVLGAEIERREGWPRLLQLSLLAAVLPNLLQWWWQGPGFGGLSGVVYALIGYVWLCGRIHPALRYRLSNTLMALAVLWLLWGFVAFIGPVMANGAHLGGLLVGLALAGWWHGVGRRK